MYVLNDQEIFDRALCRALETAKEVPSDEIVVADRPVVVKSPEHELPLSEACVIEALSTPARYNNRAIAWRYGQRDLRISLIVLNPTPALITAVYSGAVKIVP